MFQEYFARHPELMVWPVVGLVIFVAGFIGVLLYVFIGLRDRRKMERLARLPLQPDPEPPETSGQGRTR